MIRKRPSERALLSRIFSIVTRKAKKRRRPARTSPCWSIGRPKARSRSRKYYDKAKKYRAAVLYYNEVIRQQPGSAESEIAKKRIAQLRAKVGDAALQSAATVAGRNAKNNPKKTAGTAPGSTSPGAEGGAPVPPETARQRERFGALAGGCGFSAAGGAPDGSSPFDSLPVTQHPRRPRRPPQRSLQRRPRRRPRLSGEKLLGAALILLSLGGCAGYHIGPVQPYYLRSVHSIAVPTFENKTLVPRIAVLVTDTRDQTIPTGWHLSDRGRRPGRRNLARRDHPDQSHPGAFRARERPRDRRNSTSPCGSAIRSLNARPARH